MNVFPLIFLTVLFISEAKTRHAKRLSSVKIVRVPDYSPLFSDEFSQNQEQQPSTIEEKELPIIRHGRFNGLDKLICKRLGCDNTTVGEILAKITTKATHQPSTPAPKSVTSFYKNSEDDRYNHNFVESRRRDKNEEYDRSEKNDDSFLRTNEYAEVSKPRRHVGDHSYRNPIQVCTFLFFVLDFNSLNFILIHGEAKSTKFLLGMKPPFLSEKKLLPWICKDTKQIPTLI